MTILKNAATCLALLAPSLAMAHPGHSPVPASSPLHRLLAHPDGVVVVLALVVTAALMRWAADRAQA